MTFPRALALAAALIVAGFSEAAAQFPPPPGQQQNQASPFPPPPGQGSQASPFPPPPGQSQSGSFPQPQGQAAQPSGPSPFPSPTGRPGGFTAAPAQPSAMTPGAMSPGAMAPGGMTPGGGFPPPGSGGSGPNKVCEQFPAIRAQAEQDAAGIKAAADRKASREEICAAFAKFAVSEGRMAKFLETNQAACGVPPAAVKQVKGQHAKTAQIRKQICSAGPGGGAPRAPSLSDALGGPTLTDEAPKPGRGTLDTLTGNALGR